MTQIQLTDQQLNRALAELMGYTVKLLPIGANGRQLYALVTTTGRERLPALIIDNAYLDAPDYAGDPAASLEVQTAAYKKSPIEYMRNVAEVQGWNAGARISIEEAGELANASPRERAEAAYITLQGKRR